MKTAVVTGTSYGIGKLIAELLLQNGWKVYGISRSKADFAHERFIWLQCDLSQPEQITECLKTVKEPTIDLLVSNAGVVYIEEASLVTKESYEKTFSINVLAPMLLVGALRDKIRQATMISVSSNSDRIPDSELALYCSSKAANTLYFNSLANELKEAKVYTLLPSYVDTPMLRNIIDNDQGFDWDATIKAEDLAAFTGSLIDGTTTLESGANIIIVTDKLVEDLQSVEKLYGFNTDSNELTKLQPQK